MFNLFKPKKRKHDLNNDFIWISVNDSSTCPECKKRHGQIKSAEQWKKLGLPGLAKAGCKDNCRCVIFQLGMFMQIADESFNDDPLITQILNDLR